MLCSKMFCKSPLGIVFMIFSFWNILLIKFLLVTSMGNRNFLIPHPVSVKANRMWRQLLKASHFDNICTLNSFWGLILGNDVGDKFIHSHDVCDKLIHSIHVWGYYVSGWGDMEGDMKKGGGRAEGGSSYQFLALIAFPSTKTPPAASK